MHDLTQKAPPAFDSLRPARPPLIARLLGKAMALSYRLTGKDRYDDFRLERVRGVPFVVMPSVFNPKVPRTGEFLASRLDARLVGRDAEVLDMGTGCGVCAVFAAKHARRVVAVDINAEAVRCAGINARLNHQEAKIDVRQGDLFEPVRSERFDLVLFNPPFLRGTPRDDRDRAWRSSDVAERFAAGLGDHRTRVDRRSWCCRVSAILGHFSLSFGSRDSASRCWRSGGSSTRRWRSLGSRRPVRSFRYDGRAAQRVW
jgi:methylase of polypeptide subunit release factors